MTFYVFWVAANVFLNTVINDDRRWLHVAALHDRNFKQCLIFASRILASFLCSSFLLFFSSYFRDVAWWSDARYTVCRSSQTSRRFNTCFVCRCVTCTLANLSSSLQTLCHKHAHMLIAVRSALFGDAVCIDESNARPCTISHSLPQVFRTKYGTKLKPNRYQLPVVKEECELRPWRPSLRQAYVPQQSPWWRFETTMKTRPASRANRSSAVLMNYLIFSRRCVQFLPTALAGKAK